MEALRPVKRSGLMWHRCGAMAILLGLWLAGFGHNMLHALSHHDDIGHFDSSSPCLLADMPQAFFVPPAEVMCDIAYVSIVLSPIHDHDWRRDITADYRPRAPPYS